MLGLWLNVPQAILAVDSLAFTKNHQEMSIECFANFWVFQGEFALLRSCTGTIRRVSVDCSESALLFCSQELREQRQSDDLNRAFSAGILDSTNPGAMPQARRELRLWR